MNENLKNYQFTNLIKMFKSSILLNKYPHLIIYDCIVPLSFVLQMLSP